MRVVRKIFRLPAPSSSLESASIQAEDETQQLLNTSSSTHTVTPGHAKPTHADDDDDGVLGSHQDQENITSSMIRANVNDKVGDPVLSEVNVVVEKTESTYLHE